MRRTTALVLAVVLGAVPAAGCGEEEPVQTAEQFCAEHGGVDQATVEPDGDVTCMDGTEFEADGGDESGESSTKRKRKRR